MSFSLCVILNCHCTVSKKTLFNIIDDIKNLIFILLYSVSLCKCMRYCIFLFTLCLTIFAFSGNVSYAAKLNKVAKTVSSTANASGNLDKVVKDAVKAGTDEMNKNVKGIVEDVKKDMNGVVSDLKKDINSVVDDAKKEIKSVQGTIEGVKKTVYSVKASFDKIIVLLKVLIAMVGILIALLTFTLLNKILKILKITKSIVDVAKKN